MTQKLEDLLKSFSGSSFEEQLEKIKHIRNARTVERPAAATKRIKKEKVKSTKAAAKGKDVISKLTPEEKAALIKKLLGAKK